MCVKDQMVSCYLGNNILNFASRPENICVFFSMELRVIEFPRSKYVKTDLTESYRKVFSLYINLLFFMKLK